MSNKQKRRYRRADKTGRSKGVGRFVMLPHWLLESEAYRSLRPIPRAVHTEIRRRFNGLNNGEIWASIRGLAEACNCSKDGVTNALAELQTKGFIKCAQPGSFQYKIRHAAKWILTDEPYKDALPSQDFMRWRVVKEKSGPDIRTRGPETRTDVLKSGLNDASTRPGNGTDDAK